jgi:succinyl-diaminopimelate desuccinylase
MTLTTDYAQLDSWIDAHFDEETAFLQQLIRVPTDTPPGNNAPHAERTAELIKAFGFDAEKHPVPEAEVRGYGMESITNLIVRRHYGNKGEGKTIALNAHGDVVPPGEGWTKDPYGGEIEGGKLYGRASAVSKCDFASFTFAVRALESLNAPLKGSVELHFTYDEEFGGEMGPGWLLKKGLTKPDLLIAAGFSYEVVTAHNGCLQMEVTVHGKMAHAAIPDTGIDALQGAVHILNALYAQNALYQQVTSKVEGIQHPYLNVGRIEGGTNTNVVPGKVMFKLDRRMIPEENPAEGRGQHPQGDRRRGRRLQGHHGRHQAPAAGQLDAAAAGQQAFGRCHPEARRSALRPSHPGHGHTAVHRRAALRRSRHSRRDLRRRAAHRAGVPRQAGRRAAGPGRPAPRHQGDRAHPAGFAGLNQARARPGRQAAAAINLVAACPGSYWARARFDS